MLELRGNQIESDVINGYIPSNRSTQYLVRILSRTHACYHSFLLSENIFLLQKWFVASNIMHEKGSFLG